MWFCIGAEHTPTAVLTLLQACTSPAEPHRYQTKFSFQQTYLNCRSQTVSDISFCDHVLILQ